MYQYIYILDFYCVSARLGLEIDGEIHNGKAAHFYDLDRTRGLSHLGIKIIRFANEEVFEDTESVKKKIPLTFRS